MIEGLREQLAASNPRPSSRNPQDLVDEMGYGNFCDALQEAAYSYSDEECA